jgi:hypothetical protein
MYDPLSEKTVDDIPVSSEGYLEPVRTNNSIDSSKKAKKDVNKNSIKENSPVKESRNVILASQPIYEEINGNELWVHKDCLKIQGERNRAIHHIYHWSTLKRWSHL